MFRGGRAGRARGWRFGLGLALVLGLGAASASAIPPAPDKALPATPGPATGLDMAACRSCHEKQVAALQPTPHGRLEQSCTSCHGDLTAHLNGVLEKGEPGPVAFIEKRPAGEINKTCLSCHDRDRHANWGGGMHDRRGLSCVSCHSVHDAKSEHGQLKTARDMDTCGKCHAQIRAKALRASHHPVREGLLGCANCHDPHDGTRLKMVSAESANEKCYSCHAEKRGPFLWEHAPVRENCMNCHDPHGSNHQKMLVARLPQLCQRCHLNVQHPSSLYDARNTVAGVAGVVPVAGVNPNLSSRLAAHGCRNCHQNIHGSNAPSGPRMGR